MTTEEINEIKEAISHINYTRTVPGRYYDLCRAVLPLLEYGLHIGKYAFSLKTDYIAYPESSLFSYAAAVAKVVNTRQPLTILEEKGKKGFQEIEPGTKQPTKYTSKMLKSKPAPKLHPEIAKQLKKEGRIIEKGKDK